MLLPPPKKGGKKKPFNWEEFYDIIILSLRLGSIFNLFLGE